MPIMFRCANCSAKIKVPDDKAGKKGKCPKCKAIVEIPFESDAEFLELAQKPRVTAKSREDKTVYMSNDENFDDEDVPELADEEVPPLVDEEEEEEIPDPRALADKKRSQTGIGKSPLASSRHSELLAKRLEAKNKKGGGFFWVLFGFILVIAHTIAAILLGVSLTLQSIEKDEKSLLEPAYKIMKFDTRIEKIKAAYKNTVKRDATVKTSKTDASTDKTKK